MPSESSRPEPYGPASRPEPNEVRVVLLLPVKQPGRTLLELIDDLRAAAPEFAVLVIDDGSDDAAADQVLRAARERGCTVLRLRRNRGKGVALRVGLRYAALHHPGRHVACADADGQHRAADIVKVAVRTTGTGRLTLGVRHFDAGTPLRSRAGNALTRVLFALVTGCRVRDTQTGLRAYPGALLDWVQRIPGDGFDFEMNVLLYATRDRHPIEQTRIATRYLKDNESSHFDPVADSVRVYWPLLRFGATSLLDAARRTAKR